MFKRVVANCDCLFELMDGEGGGNGFEQSSDKGRKD